MPRILLIGKTGQLGWDLHRTLASLGQVIAPGREQMDLTVPDSIRAAIRTAAPDVIVNAAGFTVVDQAETDPGLVMQVNGTAPGILAEEAKRIDALLVHYSTTFVFDGTKTEPYVESDLPNPVNTYGKTKLAGEQAITSIGGRYIILRASWSYSHQRVNFALTILRLARERAELAVVDDQVGTPTWSKAYAETTAELLGKGNQVGSNSGIYHLSAAGQTTRYQWARKIIETAQKLSGEKAGWASVRPITTAELPLDHSHISAQRPLYTVMNNSKIKNILGIQMRHWEDELDAFLSDLPATALGAGAVPTHRA